MKKTSDHYSKTTCLMMTTATMMMMMTDVFNKGPPVPSSYLVYGMHLRLKLVIKKSQYKFSVYQ